MSTSTFAALKKNSNMSKILGEMEKVTDNSSAKNYTDDRIWKLTRDKSGSGSAVIHFLPASEGEDVSFIRIWSHSFQGPTGRYYIENSLTTIGQQDYIAEQNTELWNTGIESNKAIVRSRKRHLNYYSNILVVNDPANPENNGKVFLFKYGAKIFEMLMNAIKPPFPDEPAINPFDPWAGANFRLRIRQDGQWATYADSKFDSSAPMFGGDDSKIEEVWRQQYSLQELLDPKHFKSYDELKKKYELAVTGKGASLPSAANTSFDADVNSFENSLDEDVPLFSSNLNDPKPKVPVMDLGDEDDDMSYFQSLASED